MSRPRVAVRGGGVAAAVAARLLRAGGCEVAVEVGARAGVPAVLLSDPARALLRDAMGVADLFEGLPRVARRVVDWGGASRTMPHAATLVPGPMLDALGEPGGQAAGAADFSLLAGKASDEPVRFGERAATAVPVRLEESRSECRIEAVASGWLFLMPAPFREESHSVPPRSPYPGEGRGPVVGGSRESLTSPDWTPALTGVQGGEGEAPPSCSREGGNPVPCGVTDDCASGPGLPPAREHADAGWLLAIGDAPDTLLAESRSIAPHVSIAGPAARFDAAPRMAPRLGGADWLACGSAALGFDPVCGDGVAQSAREGILAAAVIAAIAEGGDRAALIGHYEAMLIAAMRRHLQLCMPFYATGGTSDWWRAQHAALVAGHAHCTRLLARRPEPRFVLDGFRLVPRAVAA